MTAGEELFGSIYEKGQVIFRQGDRADRMYIIQSGALEVTQLRGQCEEVLAFLEKGDLVGEIALLDGNPRTATVKTLSRSRLLPFTRESLLTHISRDPGVCDHILKALILKILRTDLRLQEKAGHTSDLLIPVVELLGKRAIHPVAMGVGCFLVPPTGDELEEVLQLSKDVRQRAKKVIEELGEHEGNDPHFPLQLHSEANFLYYDDRPGADCFFVRKASEPSLERFDTEAFGENISEMRVDWSFAKFPYLSRLGFPEGILLVGPISRCFMEGGILDEPDITEFPLVKGLKHIASSPLDNIDTCRLLEIYWAAGQIQNLLSEVDLRETEVAVDNQGSGKGIGVVEAPRGVLVHSYLVNRGIVERIRLLVATQFNNAYINLLLKDLAEAFVQGDSLSPEGQELVGRCIRIFDPCLSCATH